jgi:hypothetical protein
MNMVEQFIINTKESGYKNCDTELDIGDVNNSLIIFM